MGAIDKARNSLQNLRGGVKTTVGRLTGNRSTQAKGRGEQMKADVKSAGEQLKDSGRKLRRTSKH